MSLAGGWIVALACAGMPPGTPAEGARARFAAAWEALEEGRTGEAVAGIREAHALDPGHRPAARLAALLDRLDRPARFDGAPAPAPPTAGAWSRARGRHFLLDHQHDAAEADERIDLAERVRTTFYLWFAGLGLDLDVPDAPLRSAWFARRADYLDYLHARGDDAFAETHGHYDPASDLVAAVDERDGPAAADGRTRRSLDVATLAHETVHQLVARSGLERPGCEWPRWLHEGVAMQFESSRDGRWAGVWRPNEHRIPLYRAARPAPGLAATIRDAGFEARYDPGRYGAAWAVVHDLGAARPRDLVALIDLLRTPGAGDPARPTRLDAASRLILGDDPARAEAGWRRRMDRVRVGPADRARSSENR